MKRLITALAAVLVTLFGWTWQSYTTRHAARARVLSEWQA